MKNIINYKLILLLLPTVWLSAASLSYSQDSPELIKTLIHESWINSVAFSPDGNVLAGGGGERSINLWRVSDGQLLRDLSGHKNDVESVVFSPDGAVLVSGGADKTIK